MKTSEHVVIPNPEAIIWDFDDTLFQSQAEFDRITAAMAPEFGCPPPDVKHVRANAHGPLANTLTVALGKVSVEELAVRVARFQELERESYERPAERLYADAVDLSERAAVRGLTQIIVTNRMHRDNGKASPRAIVEATVLNGRFVEVICRDDAERLGHFKPDGRVMGTVLTDRNIDPTQTLIIGDQYVDGGLAIDLGAHAILVCRDGDEIPNMHKLPKGWQDHVTVVDSLNQVHFDFATIPRQLGGGVWQRTNTQSRVPSQRGLPGRLQASGA